jgi:hypothetical protein
MTNIIAITSVTPPQLPSVWNKASSMLAPIVRKAGDSLDSLCRQVFAGESQLTIAVNKETYEIQAVVVTQSFLRKGQNVLNIQYLAGRGINDWIVYLDQIEDWARKNKYHSVVVDRGRMGWERFLQPYGYKAAEVKMEKVL